MGRFCVLLTFLVVFSASQAAVPDNCLNCICEMMSDCRRDVGCVGNVCGLFKISWPYWADGGKYTVNNEEPEAQTAYANCAKDVSCASQTVQGYMTKFSQDCNEDGVVNCEDYARIHVHGGYGCNNTPLPDKHKAKLDSCLARAG